MRKTIGITIIVLLLTLILTGCKSGTQVDVIDIEANPEVTQTVSAILK